MKGLNFNNNKIYFFSFNSFLFATFMSYWIYCILFELAWADEKMYILRLGKTLNCKEAFTKKKNFQVVRVICNLIFVSI